MFTEKVVGRLLLGIAEISPFVMDVNVGLHGAGHRNPNRNGRRASQWLLHLRYLQLQKIPNYGGPHVQTKGATSPV